MTVIESLQVEISKLKEVKSKAVKMQQFDLAASLRDNEKMVLEKISDLLTEVQTVIRDASLKIQNIV